MWIYMITRLDTTPKDSRRARLLYLLISFILLALTSATAVINALGIYRVLFEVVPGSTKEIVQMGWAIMDQVNKDLFLYGEIVWSASVFLTDAVLVSIVVFLSSYLIKGFFSLFRSIGAIPYGSIRNGSLVHLPFSYWSTSVGLLPLHSVATAANGQL
jgi:hypothetical protein